MTLLGKTTLAAALALGTATTAQAVTFTPNVNDAFTFTFDLAVDGDVDTAFEVPIAFDFDLTVLSVEGLTNEPPILGFSIEGPSGDLLNTAAMDSTCSLAAEPTSCELLFPAQFDGFDLASGLELGSYDFTIFGQSSGDTGTVTFGVSKVSAVPLPAAGFLLLGALGALGLKRRRKAA